MNTISGAFRPSGSVFSIADNFTTSPPANLCGWTDGAVQIDAIPAPTVIGQQRTIYGWSISFVLWIDNGGGNPPRGRFGPILGGLLRGNSQTAGDVNHGGVYLTPVQALPTDTSLLVTLWDPDQSPAPPSSNGVSMPPRPATVTSSQLPQPLELSAGEQVSIGIWMMPSLVSAVGIRGIQNPTWSITYEDNRVARR